MRTNKQFTYEVLNGHFETEGGNINIDYLRDAVVIFADNNRVLYEAMKNTRRKPHSVAWEALIAFINDRLRDWHPGFYASNDQVKKWLKDHGAGYEVLAGVVEFINDTRNED